MEYKQGKKIPILEVGDYVIQIAGNYAHVPKDTIVKIEEIEDNLIWVWVIYNGDRWPIRIENLEVLSPELMALKRNNEETDKLFIKLGKTNDKIIELQREIIETLERQVEEYKAYEKIRKSIA
jgi:hypothetical protein